MSSTVARIGEVAQTNHLDYAVTGRAGLGVLNVLVQGDAESRASFVTVLRDRFLPGEGSVVIRRADAELKSLVGVWGPIGDGLPIIPSQRSTVQSLVEDAPGLVVSAATA